MAKFFGPQQVPGYQKDYDSLPWYERNLMRYYDHLKYKKMSDDPDFYFKNKEVINFDLIHHRCQGDPLKKNERDHKTVTSDDFKDYPRADEKRVLPFVFRNKRDDLWVKRDLMLKHFKENLQ